MVFSSTAFLFFFLPAILVFYYVSPQRGRNFLLLAASYFFYAWGEPKVAALLLATSLIDYWIGCGIASPAKRPQSKKLLALSITINIACLAYFKYANFFVEETQGLFSFLGLGIENWQKIALPIGISFFTFQKISYQIDIYRKETLPAKNFVNYALYVSFFPQLIAGPIVRYHDINTQIEERSQAFANVSDGFARFAIGLGKKVLIANEMAGIADALLGQPVESQPSGYLWIAIFAYTLQIYFDFSGYSDMAIGLARMFGFKLLENFNRPYIATSITDFWRRWHISLSNWMRDYLYLPLGGNRVHAWRAYVNLWIVFIISGFWHGASWSFIAWGGFHGFFLTCEKLIGVQRLSSFPRWIMQPATLIIVMIGWAIFRIEDLGEALSSIQRMFSFQFSTEEPPHRLLYEVTNNRNMLVLGIASIIAFTPKLPNLRINPSIMKPIRISAIWIVFTFSLLSLVSSSYNPFIYFRF